MRRFSIAFLFLLAASSLAGATFTVTNTNDSGAGSLRQAVLDANANPGLDTIAFNIPGAGVHTIAPATSLDPITDPVIIDGYTQPGSNVNTDPIATNAVLMIELDGTTTGGPSTSNSGLTLGDPGGSTIRGLVINRWGIGIKSSSSIANTIAGNFIGTDPTGTQDAGNSDGIWEVNGLVGDVIGGTSPADRNLVSGNLDGIAGENPGVVIQGNLIGTDATGTVAVQTGSSNFGIFCNKPGSIIGGSAAGAGNVISGNDVGLIMQAAVSNAVVQGNRIGTTADGTGPLANGAGIEIGSAAGGITIGGIGAGEANEIAFNSNIGVGIYTGVNRSVRGNSIHDNGGLGIDLTGNGPTRHGGRHTGHRRHGHGRPYAERHDARLRPRHVPGRRGHDAGRHHGNDHQGLGG